ncbi:hypothetical protein R1sor_005814 [Riccia sorocarpa]|uniref:Uncharacterized protein n=1 Tax=Riccia sorocarpa TaxID=122646 RepID=A0ABD3HKL4_9MARC
MKIQGSEDTEELPGGTILRLSEELILPLPQGFFAKEEQDKITFKVPRQSTLKFKEMEDMDRLTFYWKKIIQGWSWKTITPPDPRRYFTCKKPNLYDLWREFRFFANVSDRKYLEHLDFFIEAKAGRFFRPKEGQRRTILLSSLHGLDEELEAVQKYIFWKRRTPLVKKITPKAILMAPKSTKKRDKIPAKSPTQTPSQSPAKILMAPSSSSTPAKLGVCKSLALPTIALKEYRSRIEELGIGFLFLRWDFSAETLVKEFATAKSEVKLPHRGKPYEWTIAHWMKALDRCDEENEGGIVWDAQVARLTMPEGVNPEELFSEKRPEKDKNGYKTRSYKNPFKKVLAEALMALFCPARMMYLVTHNVAFIERVAKKEKVNWGAVFAQHVLHSLKTVNDGNPVYIGAFLVHLHAKNSWLTEEEKKLYGEDHPSVKNIADYSSDEDDTSSDEEHQVVAPQVLAKDTEDEDEDEGTPRARGVQFSFEDAVRKPKLPTSPNYSPLATPEPKTKKRMRGEVTRAKKSLRIGQEDTAKTREDTEDEDEDIFIFQDSKIFQDTLPCIFVIDVL